MQLKMREMSSWGLKRFVEISQKLCCNSCLTTFLDDILFWFGWRILIWSVPSWGECHLIRPFLVTRCSMHIGFHCTDNLGRRSDCFYLWIKKSRANLSKKEGHLLKKNVPSLCTKTCCLFPPCRSAPSCSGPCLQMRTMMMVVLQDWMSWHVTVTERRLWRRTIQEAFYSEKLHKMYYTSWCFVMLPKVGHNDKI